MGDHDPIQTIHKSVWASTRKPRSSPGPSVTKPRHEFVIVTESKPPMSEAAVCALLNAGLELIGTPIRIIEARPTDE